MPRDKERPSFVVLVATLVCVVCALLVSSAVVLLRPVQERNALLARQRNILEVAGLYHPGEPVDAQFARIEPHLVDLDTGAYVAGGDALGYDIVKAGRDPQASEPLGGDADIARIHRRPRQMPVFLVRGDAGLETVILPMYGYGLWSTMYAYVALDGSGEHVKDVIFYSHAETPGLGAEIENPRWRAGWVGKRLFGDDHSVRFDVAKGTPDAADADYHVDAISGATLTSNGVENMVHYWLGGQGYGPFLARLRDGGA